MAELVGGALLSGFLNVLFERMASNGILEFFRGKKEISKLLDNLEVMLNSANALLNDAEEKQLQNQNVKTWLEKLNDLIFDIDHAIDKINTEALRCEIEEGGQPESILAKCLTCFPVRSSLFDRGVKEELEKILASLELLLKQSNHLGLNQNVKRSSTVASSLAPLVEDSDVYGRDDEKKSLIELLLSDDVSLPKISVIPIVGMGGIGKTTLAQVVYNDARVQKHFDFKVWVTVSEEFDVPRLMKVIFESIISRKCEIEEPQAIQRELSEALRGKKFLFVHDDVWNEKYELWDVLKSAFQSGAQGSKIIVTTRSETVAEQMRNVEPYRLGLISEADCWELFAKHVFTNVDEHSDWKEMGIQFVKKCKGLPLAVKSIAGLLRSMMRREAWREILESDIWDFREVNSTNVLPALWLSYSFLPPNLKRCFAFLSVFPKDYEFDDDQQEKIILMWMAEGFLQPQSNRRAEDVGKEYLNVLVSRSFFQHSTNMYNKPVLMMHDLIHDLALFVSNSSSSKTRYVSLKETSEDLIKLEKSTDTMFLRTLMIIFVFAHLEKSTDTMLAQNVLREVGCLRELCLCKSQIKELPDSIGTLKHLRYLDLSETKIEELPASLCSLYNLQTLLLSKCEKLRCLPTDLHRLVKLRHLYIEGESLLKEMPPQISIMTDLQALTCYVISERSKIKGLAELRHLRGTLCLRRLQNVISLDDALGADMKNKKYIAKMGFEWDIDSTCEDPEKETEVLSALEPHSGIKELGINGFRGTKLPNWVAEQSFREIVKVYLIDCRNCGSLPPLGELASLKILKIKGMNGVVSVGDEFSGTTRNPFPSLEILIIENMSSWEKWSFSGSVSLFPRLKKLTIADCDKLKCGLPNCTLPALETVYIRRCKSMELFSSLPSTHLPSLETLLIKDMSSWENWSFSGSVLLFPHLKKLTIEDCDKLKCGLPNCSTLPALEFVYIRGCKSMELFSSLPSTHLPITLESVYVRSCPKLILNRLSWGLHRLSSLRELILDGYKDDIEDDSFPEEGLLPNGLQELIISDFESLKGLNGKGFQNLTALSVLSIYNCKQLQCLPPQGLPLSLNTLDILVCPLLKNQCERETGNYWPKIQHIPKILIDEKQI